MKKDFVPASIADHVGEISLEHTINQLKQKYQNFKIKGESFDYVFPTAMGIIGIGTPKQALTIIKDIHKDHRGETGNVERYHDNLALYEDLKDKEYVEIPVDLDLSENTRLPNDLDIDILYSAEVFNLIDVLNEQINEAYDNYEYEHSNTKTI